MYITYDSEDYLWVHVDKMTLRLRLNPMIRIGFQELKISLGEARISKQSQPNRQRPA